MFGGKEGKGDLLSMKRHYMAGILAALPYEVVTFYFLSINKLSWKGNSEKTHWLSSINACLKCPSGGLWFCILVLGVRMPFFKSQQYCQLYDKLISETHLPASEKPCTLNISQYDLCIGQ